MELDLYDRANATLTYKFPELKTGLSVRKFISLKTKNGVTPNDTVLKLSSTLSKSNASLLSETGEKEVKVTAGLSPTISKKFVRVVNDSSAYAARPGDDVVYKITATIPAPVESNPGTLYLQEGNDITITDQFDGKLTYVSTDDSSIKPEISVEGQKVTWKFKAPYLKDQKNSKENLFQAEFYVRVKVSDAIIQDMSIDNKVHINAVALGGNVISDVDSNVAKVDVLIPGKPISEGAVLPVRKTYGPDYTSTDLNPNIGRTEDQAVGFTDIYRAGADSTDYIINADTKEPYEWNVNSVLKDGYREIVATYTPSDNLILRSLYPILPYGYKTPTTYLQLNKIPRTIVEYTLDDNSKKTYEFDWTNISKQVTPQPQGQDLAYEAIGLKKEDKVKSFTVTYKNADGSLIDGRFAEQFTSRYDVVPGTADKPNNGNRVELKTEYLVTLADGTKVYRGPNPDNKYGTDVAVRYTTILNDKLEPPKVEERVDFMKKDGSSVTDGDNRVQVILMNNRVSLSKIENTNSKIESVVVLPLGVTIKNDPSPHYYVRSQRAYTFTENIPPGKITVLSNDYNRTGRQAVKVTWDRDKQYPGEFIFAEFDVNIDKNAPDILTMDAYGFGTTYQDKMSGVVEQSPIIKEETDINADGITGKDIVTRKAIFTKATEHDLKIEKFVKGSYDTKFSNFGYTTPGGNIDYKIKMTNTTGENIFKLGFIDVLPSVGDIGIVDNVPRESAFAPTLNGAVKIPDEWKDKVTVYYSTEANPKRSDILYNKVKYPTGSFEHQDPDTAVAANWMIESAVTDWSSIKSFKIELNKDDIWVKGQDIELTFSMKAPSETDASYIVSLESSQLPKRTDALEKKAAWNSFAVTTNTLLPTEPERVGVVVINDVPPIAKKISDSTNGEYELDKNTQKFFYRINTRLPIEAQSFEVTDSLDKALMLVENDPSKIVVNVDGSASTVVATSSDENGQTKISVKFDETFIKNNSGKDVEIIFNAQVKPDADLSNYVNGKIPNTADYIINDNPETKKTTPPVNVVVKGTVIAQYFIEGTDTKLQDDKSVKEDEVVGEQYSDVPPKTLVKDGKTYVLVESNNIPTLKESSAPQEGNVVAGIQEIKYQYKLASAPEIKKNVDGSTEKELANIEETFTYNINTTFPIGATTFEVSDKLVSELEYVSDSLRVLVDGNEFSEATVSSDGGVVRVTFSKAQIAANEGKEIKISFKANIKAGANLSKYENGKIPNTASYTIDGNPDTKKTTDPVNVSVKKGGEVLVQYVIQGTNDQLSDPSNTNPSADNPGMYIVQPKDTAVGTEYSTTPPATLVKDGKTYELVEIRKNPTDASASGKVTEDKQIVTYEYKLKEEPPVVTPKGSVIVHYEDESGKVIAPSNKIKDNAPVGEEYDSTTPKNRPNEITTDDGKVYELVKYDPKNGSDMPTGKVIEGTKNITYVYRLKTIPEISKKVDVDKIHLDVQTGKEYTYNITVKIPNDISNHNKFEITDELDSRLTVVGASITGDNSKYFNETKIEGNKVIASISDFAKADEIKGTSVELVITAKINNGVIIDKIPNSAVVVYNKNGLDGNPTEDNTTPPTPPVTVTPNYGGGSVVVKYEDENGNPIKDDNTVNPKGTAPGTPYDTTTINNRPKEIINNGKTYVLVKEDPKAGSDNPKGTVEDGKDKVVTYVYKLKKEVPETEKPSITKKINENIDYLLVENEKSFNYNIKTTIPLDIEKYTKFEISDAIDSRLTVVNVSIKGDTQGLFTVTENNGVISAKMSDFAKAKGYAGKVIELVVTAKIKNGITSSIPNVASVTYNNTPGTTTDKKETTTPVTVVPTRPGTPITPNDNPGVPSFEEPKISKVINGSLLDLQIGNEKSFKYNITSYLPNDIANYTKYVITDKVDNNIKVVSAKVVGDASKYFDVVVKDNTVTATMKDFGNANVFAGKNIELEITSEINKGVKTVNIPNTATVSYKRSSGSESEKKSNTVYVTPNNNSNGTSSTNNNNNTTTTNNNNTITKLPKTGDSNLTQIVGLVALSISLLLLSSYRKSKKL